tara:strand:+ start:145 stop:2277 length:2133 start_codon:yes stop_codon:yes gene_type:complete
LTWYSILKARINWTNSFKSNKWPDEKDINSLDEKEKATILRELDTTINNIESQIKVIPNQRPDLPEGIVQRLMFPRKGSSLTIKDIESRVVKLKSFKSKFGITIVTRNDVVEQLQPLVDNFSNSKSEEDFYELYKYVHTITDNQWKSAPQKWMRNLSNVVNVPDSFLLAIDRIKLIVEGGIDKKVANIFGIKYASGNRTIREVRGGSKDTIIDEDDPLFTPEDSERPIQTKKNRRASDAREITASRELTTKKAFAVSQLDLKISQLSLIEFRKVMKLIHLTGITKGHILQPFTGTAVDILHDISIARQRKLNNTIRVVDFGRKGIQMSHRKGGMKTDFAIAYMNGLLDKNKIEFKVGKNTLVPSSLEDTLTEEEMKDNQASREEALQHIKRRTEETTGNIPEAFKEYVQSRTRAKVKARPLLEEAKALPKKGEKGSTAETIRRISQLTSEITQIYNEADLKTGAASMGFYLGQDKDVTLNYNDVIESFDISADKIFTAVMFTKLFKTYTMVDSEAAFTNEFQQIIVLGGKTGKWTEFVPKANVFQQSGEESFMKSMRTILTFITTFYGKGMLADYNLTMTDLVEDFYINMQEAEKILEDEMGIDTKDERMEMISEGMLKDFGHEKFHTDLMGIKESMATVTKQLDTLLLNLDEKVHTVIYDLIKRIGEDTSTLYTKNTMDFKGQPAPAKKHLIGMELLQEESDSTEGEEE